MTYRGAVRTLMRLKRFQSFYLKAKAKISGLDWRLSSKFGARAFFFYIRNPKPYMPTPEL